MSKNEKKDPEKDLSNYYELKSKAVDDLKNAMDEDPYRELEKEEIEELKREKNRPYRNDFLSKMPAIVKVLLVKYWFGGLICFLFFIGLSIYINSLLDFVIILGIATGVFNDLFVTSIFLHFQSDRKEYNKYLVLPISAKKIWTLFIHIPLGILEVFIIFYIYQFIGTYIYSGIKVEPLLYGLINLTIDMAFVGIKDLIVFIIKKIKRV